jgi:predicted dinucleotide-utilizing enzyme
MPNLGIGLDQALSMIRFPFEPMMTILLMDAEMTEKQDTFFLSNHFANLHAKAERPRLTRRPKASIWLVHHHLRSLNTVNEGHFLKNMSID